MGKYAVVQHDMVENVIVLDDQQIEEFENILNAELINAIPYGLCVGDLRVGNQWTRNIDGIQTILESLTPEQQTDCNFLQEEIYIKTNILKSAEIALTEGVESIG